MKSGIPLLALGQHRGISTMFRSVAAQSPRTFAQLERQIATLSDKSAPTRARNEALKWIVHLVGDIHQPLHAADNADRGGNGVLVRGAANLHSVWDVLVVQQSTTQKQLSLPITVDQVAEWQKGGISSWMAESHRLAETVVYGKRPSGWVCNAVPKGRIDLGGNYLETAAPVAAQQLQKAGARLARVLNDALK